MKEESKKVSTGARLVQVYLILGCIFDILLGVACIVLSWKAKSVDEDLFPEEDQKNYQKNFCIAMYVLGAVSIATGLLGIYGFIRRNVCIQSLFIFLNILYTLAFGAIFGVSIYANNYINDQMTDSKCLEGDLGDANTTFLELKKVWCNVNPLSAMIACPCYIPDTSKWTADEMTTLKANKNAIKSDKVFVPIPSETISECNYFLTTIAEQKAKEIKLIKAVERNFSCTGVCEGDLVYYFNNINSGRPENGLGCYGKIRSKLNDWAKYVYVISIVIAATCLVNVIAAFINCCIGPQRKYSKTERKEQY